MIQMILYNAGLFVLLCIAFWIIFLEIPAAISKKNKKAAAYYYILLMVLFAFNGIIEINMGIL